LAGGTVERVTVRRGVLDGTPLPPAHQTGGTVINFNITELVTTLESRNTYKDLTGKNIKEKEHIKDLGVHISNGLTWTKQIEVVSKARSMSGWTMIPNQSEAAHVNNLELTG